MIFGFLNLNLTKIKNRAMEFKKLQFKPWTALTALLIICNLAFGQKGREDGSKYGHGEDSIRCLRNLSLYQEYYKQDAYKDALPFWKIVFAECPQSSKNLYIHGAKMYTEFMDNEKNDVRLKEMFDTLMLIYDERIEYFDDRGNVLGRKGVDMLKYMRLIDPKYLEEGYNILKESINLMGAKSSTAVLATFMTANVTLYDDGVLDPETVIQNYATVSDIFDQMLEKRKSPYLISIKDEIDDNMVGKGILDCETLIDFYTPKFEANPEDVELLKKLTNFLDKLECTNSELYYQSAVNLHKLEPSATSAAHIASMSSKRGEYSEADKYYKQAIEMEEDALRKAELYYGLAYVSNELGSKSEARSNCLNAIKNNPNWGEPYLFIGNLYADSKDLCSTLELPKSIYWAAVDKFIKAKSVDPGVTERADKYINTYSAYFPNKEEAFFYQVYEGDTYTVGCWINEQTKVRF